MALRSIEVVQRRQARFVARARIAQLGRKAYEHKSSEAPPHRQLNPQLMTSFMSLGQFRVPAAAGPAD